MGLFRTRHLAVSTVFALLATTACGEPYDFERKDYERESLGDELHAIWLKDARRAPENAEARVELLQREEDDFVRAVNTLAPPDELEQVDHYMRNTVPLTRSGVLPSLTRKLRLSLEMATADDRLLQAMVSDGDHLGAEAYLAPGARPNLPHYLLQYDDLRRVTTTLGDAMLEADGVDPHGKPVPDESTTFRDAQLIVADSLSEAEDPDQSRTVSTVATFLRDVLLVEDGRFHAPDRQSTLPAVAFDDRGYPLVRRDRDGEPIRPFVDDDGDGLADVNEQGQFVIEGGQPSAQIRPFAPDDSADAFQRDPFGRAKKGEDFVFSYLDLAKTGAGFLTRQTARLHEREVLWNILDGLPELLGERTPHTDDYGQFDGYAGQQPVIDFLDSAAHLAAVDELPSIADSLARFIDRSEPELARLIDALDHAKTVIDRHPGAELADYSTIGYDLLPILAEIADDPDLWSDVMAAMREPIFPRFGEPLAKMLTYADRQTVPAKDGPYNRCFHACKEKYESRETEAHPHGIGTVGRYECILECPTDELFQTKTDFSAPESPGNRSVNAQVFHLLRDTAGVEYEMKVTRAGFANIDLTNLPAIIRLPGAAEAFIATIAGNLRMEDYVTEDFRSGGSLLGDLLDLFGVGPGDVAELLSTMSGLFGTHLDPAPTPDQVTRMFNQQDLKFDNSGLTMDVNEPVCHDGFKMAEHHADKLFASEASGLIDTVQPLAKAFSDHDREDLLAELFVVFHEHYSAHTDLYLQSDGTPSPMKGANFQSFEPPLVEIARDGRIFAALHDFARAVERTKPIDGVEFEERLRQLLENATDRDPSYEPRGVDTPLALPDGDTIENPSHLHVLLYNAGRLVDRLDDDSQATDKLTTALADISDVFLEVEQESGTYRLKRPGTFALLSLSLRELADLAERWKANGQLVTTLIESWQDDWTSFFESRTLPTLVDLLRLVADHPERRQIANELVTYMLDSDRARDQWTATLYALMLESVDAEQTAPIARFLGRLLDPGREWSVATRRKLPLLSHAMIFLQQMVERDDSGTGFAMIRRGLETDQGGTTAFGHLGEVILDYHRADPASEQPYTAADYRHALSRLAAWVGDDVHGLEQLYDIIQQGTPEAAN